MPTLLLTGGTGFVGSHACVEFMNAGFDTVLLDNLSNSSPVVVDRIAKITGKRPAFVEGDIRDRSTLEGLFDKHRVDAVVHFAGLKAVADSETRPLDYYVNNVCGSATLLTAMQTRGVHQILFSSSATVYDPTAPMPLGESSKTGPVSPYGHTKLMIERMLRDMMRADPRWRAMCLRYFNPVGAHESGLIGEDPRGTPNNLMPYIAQVAVGRLPLLRIFGNDYPTADGTGVRDYIHVTDLAMGHVAALRSLLEGESIEHDVINLGTGRGHSVFEMVHAFSRVSGRKLHYEIVERRPGDVAVSFADVALARAYLNWEARFDLERMCADAWGWQSANVDGFSGR